MKVIEPTPWSFTIEFDEAKAARNGYDVATLYDCVDKRVSSLGCTRIATGAWSSAEADEVGSQCAALSLLSRAGWFMKCVESVIAFEDDCDDPVDYLDVIRRRAPDRLYA